LSNSSEIFDRKVEMWKFKFGIPLKKSEFAKLWVKSLVFWDFWLKTQLGQFSAPRLQTMKKAVDYYKILLIFVATKYEFLRF